jgi:hypothetical protein
MAVTVRATTAAAVRDAGATTRESNERTRKTAERIARKHDILGK